MISTTLVYALDPTTAAQLLAATTNENVFDISKGLLADTKATLSVLVPVVITVFVLWKAIAARMAVTAVFMAAVAAGLMGFFALKPDLLADVVEKTING